MDQTNDRPNGSDGFAGRLAFVVPGDLDTPTGGYRYDQRIIQELRKLGCQVNVLDIGNGFPSPSPSQRATALALAMISEVPIGCPIVIDGLAFGVLPEACSFQKRAPIIALVHQPLALEATLNAKQSEALRDSEREALAGAATVIVTSNATARILVADYEVTPEQVNVVMPGNDPVPQAPGSRDGIVRVVAVGSVVPGKGYDLLIAALATMTDMPWQLSIVGDTARNPDCAARLYADTERYGLTERVSVFGALPPDRVAALYSTSDIFALASRFESYGMALAEAIAHGLPVVSTTAGAIAETVPPDAGLLGPPNDARAFAVALRRLIGNPAERRRLARNARMGAAHLPSWRDSAQKFLGAIESSEQAFSQRIAPAADVQALRHSLSKRIKVKKPKSSADLQN
jgi:glycosyltransferase involved in cell wall biosynthesis